MDLMNSYVQVMIDSLQKKNRILEKLISFNEDQKDLIGTLKSNMDQYQDTIQNKQQLIDELLLLDKGFQSIYERLKEELTEKKDLYQSKIKEMQKLITVITEKSIRIQQQEEENRSLIEQQFTLLKREVKQYGNGKKIISQYYKNMQKTSYIPPQFMDKKK